MLCCALPAAPLMRLQVLQFVHGVVALLAEVPLAEVALQLFLQAAYAASEVAYKETLAYEMFEQVWAGTALYVAVWQSGSRLEEACLLPEPEGLHMRCSCTAAGHARGSSRTTPIGCPNAMHWPCSAQISVCTLLQCTRKAAAPICSLGAPATRRLGPNLEDALPCTHENLEGGDAAGLHLV